MSQSTPYIGHPAYKAMGGRAGYTLATGLFIGLGGMLGYIAFMADALPKPALAPILVFVGLDITEQSYLATPKRHAAAVTLAVFPSIAQLVQIFLSQVYNGALLSAAIDPAGTLRATGLTNPDFISTCAVMIVLAHGFILTAMLWGGVVFLIDRQSMRRRRHLRRAAFGVLDSFIRSHRPAGSISPGKPGRPCRTIDGAYLSFAALIMILKDSRFAKENRLMRIKTIPITLALAAAASTVAAPAVRAQTNPCAENCATSCSTGAQPPDRSPLRRAERDGERDRCRLVGGGRHSPRPANRRA